MGLRCLLTFVVATFVYSIACVQAPSAEGSSDDAGRVRLIAHRGGVVDEDHIENSAPAVEEAIRRGYSMLEVDIRESKDGRLVVHHNENFRRYYGDDRRVADMTWDEIKRLKSTPGNLRPLEFAEYAALCRGKIRLMLDTKGPDHAGAFFASVIDALKENGLLESAYVIGTNQSKDVFLGKAKVGIDREKLEAAVKRGEDVAGRYFLFEHGRTLDAETVELAQKHGVTVVPSVNDFHYLSPKHEEMAARDIARLKKLGVTHFQIDSVYERFCIENEKAGR